MRQRVLQATVGTVVLAVLMLGIPLAYSWFKVVDQDITGIISQAAYDSTRQIDTAVRAGDPVDDSIFSTAAARYPDLELYFYASGGDIPEISSGEDPGRTARTVTQNGASGETVIVKIPDSDVRSRFASAWVLIIIAGMAALAVGISLALWQAQRLSAPLGILTTRASELGSGRSRGAWVPSGIAEIDSVALELQRSGQKLSERLEAERTLASDASHQLRTPLTALSMRLDEIVAISSEEDVREEARVALDQVDRLTQVVHDLINAPRSSSRRTPGVVELATVLRQQSEEWSPAFKAEERELVVQIPRAASVWASTGPLTQVVATLIENSLAHGGGRTLVKVRANSKSTVIEVGDEGEGIDPTVGKAIFERSVSGRGSTGTGVGLALARNLVEDDGGRLELLQDKPAVFGVFLISAPSQQAEDDGLGPDAILGGAPPTSNGPEPQDGEPRKPRISGLES